MRFFFDFTRDDVGMECPSLDAARIQAIVGLTEMARDWLPYDGNNRDLVTVVRDRQEQLLKVSFRFEVQSLNPHVPGNDKVLASDRRRS